MKGELTGLFLWSSPHAVIGALILEVLLREEESGGERERRGKAWQVQRGSRVEGWKGEGGEAKVESVGGGEMDLGEGRG